MERIKMKLIIAVTNKLSAAADCDAKTDLIEELSENLYERYLEYTASGMSEEEAYGKTLEELGDVNELLAYLGGDEDSETDWQFNLSQNIEELCRDAMNMAQNAVKESKSFLKDLGSKLKEKYPRGFHGCVHFNVDDGEFWEYSDENEDEDEGEYAANLPAEGIRDIEIQLQNSDVEIRLGDAEVDHFSIFGEDVNLETSLDMDAGKLFIREPRNTSFFSFGSGHIEVVIPPRHWDSFVLTGGSSDIEVTDDLDVAQMSVQTASGDVRCRSMIGTLKVGTASGDVELDGDYGALKVNTASGDIRMAVVTSSVDANSASGDITLEGTVGAVKCQTASGDLDLQLDELPALVTVRSTSGDCRMYIPDREGFSVTYKTVSGDFGTNFNLTGVKGERAYLDGGTASITAATVSGDIILRRR